MNCDFAISAPHGSSSTYRVYSSGSLRYPTDSGSYSFLCGSRGWTAQAWWRGSSHHTFGITSTPVITTVAASSSSSPSP